MIFAFYVIRSKLLKNSITILLFIIEKQQNNKLLYINIKLK